MFDHFGIRASNVDASERFFLQALAPLGVGIAMKGPYGAGLGKHGKPSLWITRLKTKAPHPRRYIWRLLRTAAARSMRSTARQWMPAAGTTALLDCAATTTPTTTPPSSLRPMAITSRLCAISLRVELGAPPLSLRSGRASRTGEHRDLSQ